MPAPNQVPLKSQAKAILAQADRNRIVSALSQLNLTPEASWLPTTNAYAFDASERIHDDHKTIPPGKEDDFAKYVSASAFLHCGDAWAYLGRAIDALVRGDVHTAVHLTYYAELRGAISLLATEGIYVGNSFSCIIDTSGQVLELSKESTHRAVWRILEAWGVSSASSSAISEILRPGGVPLNAWVTGLPGGGVDHVITDLLSSIAFDLQSFSADRDRRNTASYGPTRMNVDSIDVSAMSRMIANLWKAVEPDARGSFPVMDNHLLRNILTRAYASVSIKGSGDDTSPETVDWEEWESWLESLMPSQAVDTALHDLLKTRPEEQSNNTVLEAAFQSDSTETSPSAFIESMLSRTSILLRLSTGMCSRLIAESSLDIHEIEPWIESMGRSFGLWSSTDRPENKLDLWADAEIALEALGEVANLEQHGVLKTLGPFALSLGRTERVVAWTFS